MNSKQKFRHITSEGLDAFEAVEAKAKAESESIASGDHYNHGNALETINVMEYLAGEWTGNGVPASIVCNLLQVIKYCSPRLGRKGGMATLQSDLYKIENYAHRARTGRWMEDAK